MNNRRAYLCSTVILVILLVSPFLISIRSTARADENNLLPLPQSRNQIVKITDSGLVPSNIKMTVNDSIVLFLNSTRDSLTTLEIDFGSKKTHCASSKMVLREAGSIKSGEPFGPREFASTCFHDPGQYRFTVFGVPNFPQGLQSTIIVE